MYMYCYGAEFLLIGELYRKEDPFERYQTTLFTEKPGLQRRALVAIDTLFSRRA